MFFIFYTGIMISFPRAKRKDGLFFGHVQYVDKDSIITSLSYPFVTILDSHLQWIVNFKPNQFAKLVFTNVSLSEVCMHLLYKIRCHLCHSKPLQAYFLLINKILLRLCKRWVHVPFCTVSKIRMNKRFNLSSKCLSVSEYLVGHFY
jgi:hypothetical protein